MTLTSSVRMYEAVEHSLASESKGLLSKLLL